VAVVAEVKVPEVAEQVARVEVVLPVHQEGTIPELLELPTEAVAAVLHFM
jgi:hypothetical protein